MKLTVEEMTEVEAQTWKSIVHKALNQLNDVTGTLGGNFPPLEDLTPEAIEKFDELTNQVVTSLLLSLNQWLLNEAQANEKKVIQLVNKAYLSLAPKPIESNGHAESPEHLEPVVANTSA